MSTLSFKEPPLSLYLHTFNVPTIITWMCYYYICTNINSYQSAKTLFSYNLRVLIEQHYYHPHPVSEWSHKEGAVAEESPRAWIKGTIGMAQFVRSIVTDNRGCSLEYTDSTRSHSVVCPTTDNNIQLSHRVSK